MSKEFPVLPSTFMVCKFREREFPLPGLLQLGLLRGPVRAAPRLEPVPQPTSRLPGPSPPRARRGSLEPLDLPGQEYPRPHLPLAQQPAIRPLGQPASQSRGLQLLNCLPLRLPLPRADGRE